MTTGKRSLASLGTTTGRAGMTGWRERRMQLKPITKEGIPSALEKAERYRLLNDSSAAESICLDVLEIDPNNQAALVSLLLSITDQFIEEMADNMRRAREVLPRLNDEYERIY